MGDGEGVLAWRKRERKGCMATILLNSLLSIGATRLCSTLLTFGDRLACIHTDFFQRQRLCLDKKVLFDSSGLHMNDTV